MLLIAHHNPESIYNFKKKKKSSNVFIYVHLFVTKICFVANNQAHSLIYQLYESQLVHDVIVNYHIDLTK